MRINDTAFGSLRAEGAGFFIFSPMLASRPGRRANARHAGPFGNRDETGVSTTASRNERGGPRPRDGAPGLQPEHTVGGRPPATAGPATHVTRTPNAPAAVEGTHVQEV